MQRQPPEAAQTTPLHLVLQIGDERTKTVALRLSERIIVGRAGDGDGQPPDLDLTRFGALERGVSKQHAAILYHDQQLGIEDLGSTNGTRINGLAIAPHSPYRLRSGDELEFGSLRVVVRVIRARS